MVSKDPLAAALDGITTVNSGGQYLKVVTLFGDRPDVLDAIIRARRDRRLSFNQIAMALSTVDEPISEGAVKNWLMKRGVS